MLTKRIIPCLDVKDGRVVKGIRFLQLKDAGDPVECAKSYDAQNADELVFLDITASYERRGTMISVVEKVAESIYIPFTVGGGIRQISDIRDLLKAGSDKVSVNTAAIENPGLIQNASRRFGSQCIVLAVDARREKNGAWRVYSHGGRKATALDAIEWAKTGEKLGAGEILLTSMDRDGTQEGYDLELLHRISQTVRIPLIASGGAGNSEHLYEAFEKGGADACLAASIFHFGTLKIPEVKAYLQNKGVPIRGSS